MTCDGDQRATPEFFGLLFQYEQNIFTNAGGTDVVEPELDDAGQGRTALKQELGEVEILGEDNRAVIPGPAHDLGVGGIGRPQLTPVVGGVAVAAKKLHPRNG